MNIPWLLFMAKFLGISLLVFIGVIVSYVMWILFITIINPPNLNDDVDDRYYYDFKKGEFRRKSKDFLLKGKRKQGNDE